MIEDFRDWPYSSYKPILSHKTTQLRREDALAWFGDREWFVKAHLERDDVPAIQPLISDDFD